MKRCKYNRGSPFSASLLNTQLRQEKGMVPTYRVLTADEQKPITSRITLSWLSCAVLLNHLYIITFPPFRGQPVVLSYLTAMPCAD